MSRVDDCKRPLMQLRSTALVTPLLTPERSARWHMDLRVHRSQEVKCIRTDFRTSVFPVLLAGKSIGTRMSCVAMCKDKPHPPCDHVNSLCNAAFWSSFAALSSLFRPGYFLGFYFWLDAIGTSSLVFEVPTVRIKFFGGSEYISVASAGSFFSNAGNQLYISSKAGRVARVRPFPGSSTSFTKVSPMCSQQCFQQQKHTTQLPKATALRSLP